MVAFVGSILVTVIMAAGIAWYGKRRPVGKPLTWGEAMAALLVEVKAGRPGDGIVAAIEQVGAVLAEHFPRSATDTNEIPDKLIEL